MSVFKLWHRLILMAALAGVTISILAWIAWHDPAIIFLPHDRRAEWIVFPGAVDARAHWFASLNARFRREFVLVNQPPTARLSVRGMRRTEVDCCKCAGFATNAGRVGVVACDLSRFQITRRDWAVRLAERACALTHRRIPALLDTLAVAYAEAGDFAHAISTIEEALNLARSSGDSDAIKLSERILASLRGNLPYREEPE